MALVSVQMKNQMNTMVNVTLLVQETMYSVPVYVFVMHRLFPSTVNVLPKQHANQMKHIIHQPIHVLATHLM